MSEHREWGERVYLDESITALRNEHNATVRAYRDAMAECERLGKANDDACDQIAELERQTTIRVPFSDEKIEAMAKACANVWNKNGEWYEKCSPLVQVAWHDAIRAALAAGGIEPCAMPEYDPKGVALTPERPSDEELALAGRNAYELASDRPAYSLFDEMSDEAKVGELASARAIKARVAAPLLAEIERLTLDRDLWRKNSDLREAERDTLAARVAELEAIGVNLQQQASDHYQASLALRAELEVVKADHDRLPAENAELMVASNRVAQNLMNELAALRQPVDPDAWKTEINGGLNGPDLRVNSAHENDVALLVLSSDEWYNFSPEQAAEYGTWLVSFAAAHGCPVALPAPETRPVKVRCSLEPEDISNMVNKCYADGFNQLATCKKVMDHVLLNAVIDVPAGVPSVEELMDIGQEAMRGNMPSHYVACYMRTVAIRNAVLDGVGLPLPTPHEPTPEEVEALARGLCSQACGIRDVWPIGKEYWLNIARDTFKHFGRPASSSNAEMQLCINRKNRRIDALEACVKKWKAKAKAQAQPPVAPAETLEQLAEMARGIAWDWDSSGDEPDSLPLWASLVAAILRAARPRVELCASDFRKAYYDGEWESLKEKVNSSIVYGVEVPTLAVHTGPTRAEVWKKFQEIEDARGCCAERYKETLDWLLPQLPTERAEVPSVELVAKIIRGNAENIPLNAPMIARRAEAILTALAPWLHTPTGWECNVTVDDISNILLPVAGLEVTVNQASKHVIDLFKSRIRPTFGPCKECESNARRAYDDMARYAAARAALEGE